MVSVPHNLPRLPSPDSLPHTNPLWSLMTHPVELEIYFPQKQHRCHVNVF